MTTAAPENRATREDGSFADKQSHAEQLARLTKNQVHARHHYDPKIQKKAQRANADLNMDREMPDRVERLRDENIHLRSSHNQLEDQVKVIAAKLRRQIGQLKSDRIVGGGGKPSDTAQFQADLETLLEEDVKLQEEEKALMAKCKKLQQQRKDQLAEGKNLYSVAEEHQIRRQSKVETDQLQVINSLKVQIEAGNKKIVQLKQQINGVNLSKDHTVSTDELQAEKRQTEVRLMHARSKLEDIRAQNRVKEDIYKDNRSYEQQLMAMLTNAQNEQTKLQQQHRQMEMESSQTKEMRERLLQVRCDRDRLQADFDALMRQPFFQQAAGSQNLKAMEGLQNTLQQKEKEILDLKASIAANDRDLAKIAAETKTAQREKQNIQEQLSKISKHIDPFELTLDDVMSRLKVADPGRFREVMEDLKMAGSDPSWYQMFYTDQISQLTNTNPTNLNDTQPQLKFRDQLISEKAKLASELQRVQNLLKLQVDIDRQNSALMQAELNQVKQSLRSNATKTTEMNMLIKGRNERLITMQQAIGPSGLSKQDLDKFNSDLSLLKREANRGQQDAMSEFSVITDESEMDARENRLDLRVSTATFERVSVMQLMGGQELTPSQFRTFLTVDFYNHDSKHTDQTESFEPIYNTLFSFKNQIDDFYLSHLEKDSVLVDVFAVPPPTLDNQRAQGAIKLGQARLPLVKLVEGDFSFQAQEIMHETVSGAKIRIGKLFFRMRMRKPLDQALKWYNQAKLLKGQEQDAKSQSQLQGPVGNKIIEICVMQANNLQITGMNSTYHARRMLPFFSYEFYTFEVRSPTTQGNCPTFDSVKQFQVEASPQFLHYMKTQTLQIHLIDESVDMTQTNTRDYIGTVRIPLRDVILKKSVVASFQVLDENRKVCGELSVKIVMHDAPSGSQLAALTDSQQFSQATRITFDVVGRIAQFMANGHFDLDMYLDMLMAKDLTQSGRVSRGQITEFFVNDLKIGSVTQKDIEILLKTHHTLGALEFINRQDLLMVFEKPYAQAKDRALYLQSNQQMYTGYGSKQQQQLMRESFGSSQPAQRPVANPFESSQKAQPQTTSQPAQSTSNVDTKQLEATVKEKLYEILNKFQLECGVDFPGATQAQTVKVLQPYGSVAECEAFFRKFAINDLLFYKDYLTQNFGEKAPIPVKRTKAQTLNLQRIKKQILQYMIQKDYNVDELFAVLKARTTNMNDIKEEAFTKGLAEKVTTLTNKDLADLFQAIDTDKSNSVSLAEIKAEFADIDVAMILKDIRDQNMDVPKLFKTLDPSGNGRLDVIQFADLINLGSRTASKAEVDLLFRVVDKDCRGYLTEADLQNAFKNIELTLDRNVSGNPKDLFMPLVYKIKVKLSLRADAIFTKFRNDNRKVTVLELAAMFQQFLSISLTEDERATVDAFLMQYYNTAELSAEQVNQLFAFNWTHRSLGQGSETIVKQTAKKVKQLLEAKSLRLPTVLERYQSAIEVSDKEINIRNFKLMLRNISQSVDSFEIDNMIHFIDKQHTGFVSTVEILKILG